MNCIRERIDQIVADLEHGEEHQPGNRRADRRREPKRLDQPDRQQDAEQPREDAGEEPILVWQRRVLDTLHATLRVGDIDEDRLELRLLDGVDPAIAACDIDSAASTVEQAVGDIGAIERERRLFLRQEAQHFGRRWLLAQLAAQCVHVGDLAEDDRPLHVVALGLWQHVARHSRQVARGVDHQAPQPAAFPPALIRGVVAEAEEQRQRGTEQRKGQGRRMKRQDVIGDRDDDVPDEKTQQWAPDLAQNLTEARCCSDDQTKAPLLTGLLMREETFRCNAATISRPA